MSAMNSAFKTRDGLTLHTVTWLPNGTPKAVVIIVHGYAEHIGRYDHVAAKMVASGYAVYGLDQRGHGKSDGERVYFRNFEQLIDDLRLFFDEVKRAHPDLKVFIYGHSMGSLTSLKFALRYQSELAGLIVSGTAVNGPDLVPLPLQWIGRIVAPIIPKVRFAPLTDDFNNLSRDAEVVEAYIDDPLVDTQNMRVGVGAHLIDACGEIKREAANLTLPILLMHGEADALTPASGSRDIYGLVSSPDKLLKIYPQLRHEIVNEPEKDVVIGDMIAWLAAHLA